MVPSIRPCFFSPSQGVRSVRQSVRRLNERGFFCLVYYLYPGGTFIAEIATCGFGYIKGEENGVPSNGRVAAE